MGNFNPNYFERKAGSLERAVLDAVNGVKTQIDLEVGDMLVYSGCELEHWREPSTDSERISLNLEMRCNENEKKIFNV